MHLLKGKVAIVTGAGQGIGKQEALLFARQGAHVIVNDVGRAQDGTYHADRVVDEIRAAGGSADANHEDVSSWEGARSLVQRAVDVDGHLDVLLCNAGIVRDRMSFNMDEDQWDAVVKVHLKGHFAPTRFAAEHWRGRFKETGMPVNGRLIYTTSEAGMYTHTGQANYAAAKAGIIGLGLCVAGELEPYGVTVNTISPRARTPMTETTFGDIEVPAGGFDEHDARNIAPWPTFLASDHAAKITAEVFVVYGGSVQRMNQWSVGGLLETDHTWQMDELVARADELIPGLEHPVQPFPGWKPNES